MNLLFSYTYKLLLCRFNSTCGKKSMKEVIDRKDFGYASIGSKKKSLFLYEATNSLFQLHKRLTGLASSAKINISFPYFDSTTRISYTKSNVTISSF